MPSPIIASAFIWEGYAATCMARILGNSGTAITQASLTSITYYVYDPQSATPNTAIATGSVTISSAVSDTLVTNDARWRVDTTGRNFIYTIAGSAFPDPRRHYEAEFVFDPSAAGEENFLVKYELTTKATRTG